MPSAQLGDIELYYEQHGEGTPLLLVSGLAGVGALRKPNILGLSRPYRVIVHDHRGTGQSEAAVLAFLQRHGR